VLLWRRSLQLRVVTSTLLVSAVVVALLGVLLVGEISRGLVEAKRRTALAEADSGLQFARAQFSAAPGTDSPSVESLLDDLTLTLASRGSRAGLYNVVLLSGSAASSGRESGEADEGDIPLRLREEVAKGQLASVYTTLGDQPGLVVGAPLVTGEASYQLYYLFPLSAEVETLSLIRRTLTFAGLALVLLLAGIAGLVTRQVVRPVRLAAQVAERLAAGRLEQRMEHRGEDDLARLARSFNRMAESLSQQITQLGSCRGCSGASSPT